MFGLDKIGLYAIGALLAAGVIFGIYYSWKSNIEQRALLEYNQKQLEQSLKDAENLKKKLGDIEKQQAAIIKQTEDDRKAYEEKMKSVDDYLVSLEVRKSDRPASDVLKNTIKQLGGK
jgi:uncharacterized protein HemX